MFRLRIFACCCLLVGNDERHGCTSYDRRTYVPSTKQKNTSTILFFAMFVLSFDQHELFNRKNENILLLFFFCGRYSPNVRILAICYYPNPYSLFNFHFSAFGLIHFCCVEYCILFSVLLLLLVFVSSFRCVSVNVKSEIQFFRYYLSSFLLRQTESRAELLPQWLLYFFPMNFFFFTSFLRWFFFQISYLIFCNWEFSYIFSGLTRTYTHMLYLYRDF